MANLGLTKEELEQFGADVRPTLKQLGIRERRLPALVAARAALRVLPVLGRDGHFDYWRSAERKGGPEAETDEGVANRSDRRALNVLAVYYAVRTAMDRVLRWDMTTDDAFVARDASAADAIRAALDADAEAVLAADAARGAAAAFLVDTDAADFAFAAVRDAAFAFAFAADAVSRDGTNAVKADLALAESGNAIERLLEAPLWPDGEVPEAISQMFEQGFKPAVETLIGETTEPATQKALSKLLVDYERLLGPADVRDRATNRVSADTAVVDEDRLNRNSLVYGLADLLTEKNNTRHLTIGLFGHWGAGKSSVVDLLKRTLRKRPPPEGNFLVGTFQAWSYEHAKNIQAALVHEVITSLTTFNGYAQGDGGGDSNKESEKIQGGFWRHSLKLFLNGCSYTLWWLGVRVPVTIRFSAGKYPFRFLLLMIWFSLFVLSSWYLWGHSGELFALSEFKTAHGMVLGLMLSVFRIPREARTLMSQLYTKEFLAYLKLPSYMSHIGEVSEMSKDIQRLCGIRLGMNSRKSPFWIGAWSSRKRLLFIVDDLDRCGPEGIVKTFEAVRLIMDIPQVTVLIAIDQRIAMAAFAHHYRELKDYHDLRDARAIARDYLAKIIHLPIMLDDPDLEAANSYMGKVWDEKDELTKKRLDRLVFEPTSKAGTLQSGDELNGGGEPGEDEPDSDNSKKSTLSETDLARLILESPSPEAPVSSVDGLTEA